MIRLFTILSLIFLSGCNTVTKTYETEKGALTIKGSPSQYSAMEATARLKAEKEAWHKAQMKYANICLKDLKAGQEIPRDRSVSSTECYNEYIMKYVAPVSLKRNEVKRLTESYLHSAKEYEATDMTFEKYQEDLMGAYKLYTLMLTTEVALIEK